MSVLILPDFSCSSREGRRMALCKIRKRFSNKNKIDSPPFARRARKVRQYGPDYCTSILGGAQRYSEHRQPIRRAKSELDGVSNHPLGGAFYVRVFSCRDRCRTGVLSFAPPFSAASLSRYSVNGGKEKRSMDWWIVSISCSLLRCNLFNRLGIDFNCMMNCRRKRWGQLSIRGNCVDTPSNVLFLRFWSYIVFKWDDRIMY